MEEFSLLMSVYKRENPQYLTECFDSIYQQTIQPAEIILVEDGPLTAGLYEAIGRQEKRFPSMKRIALPNNQGLGSALNQGLAACQHDIIARMDTDDICVPERFETQLKYLNEHPDIDVVSAWITEFDHEPSNIVGIRSLPANHEEIFKFGKKRNPVNHPVVMFRKSAVLAAGGYKPCFLFEDYYLWGRMLQQGYHFHNLQQSLLFFRRSPEMIQRRGGFGYALHEILFMLKLENIGYISITRLVINVIQRTGVRILPNTVRSFIYKYLLRSIP